MRYQRKQSGLSVLFVIITSMILLCTTLWQTRPLIAQSTDTPIDTTLRALIAAHNLTGAPTTDRALPTIDDPLAQLGKQLFFSKALSGDLDTACASCHLPTLGGGDGLSLPIGTGARQPNRVGPGRVHYTGMVNVPRNTPTTFNVAFWQHTLFHDGRIEVLDPTVGPAAGIRTPDSAPGVADPLAGPSLLTAQSRFPMTARGEMLGFRLVPHGNRDAVRAHLVERLADTQPVANALPYANGWPAAFATVFGTAATDPAQLVSEARIAAALAAYQESQQFIDTPWRAYVQGDENAISPAAKRGALLFFTPYADGGANCVACHRGDFFTDEAFHLLAIPQIGPGKGNGVDGTEDYGRFRETWNPADLYAFRTPSLLNVAVTGPYGHDGAYLTLEGIVRHHLNPDQAIAQYDWNQLDKAIPTATARDNTARVLAQLEEQRAAGQAILQDVPVDEAAVTDLLAFLTALTDPCVTDVVCLAPWLPQAGDPDPDGLRLQAMVRGAAY